MAHRPLGNGLIVALLAAALSGCAPYMKDFYSDAPPAAKADLVQVSYDVPFRPDEQYMSDAGGRVLDEFLYTVGVDTQQDRVLVLDRDSASPWAGQRLESVRAYLARRRLPAEAGRPTADVPGVRDTVTVVIERPVLAALDCPNWTQPLGGNPENSTHRNFGCADAFNLQQMVVNKRDLAVGRPLSLGTEGELSALGIQSHRRDVRKRLEFVSTGQTNTSGGAAGQ
jgi:hypothetical protein